MSMSRSLQVRLHRLWLRVDHRWDGGTLTCTPCSSLTSSGVLTTLWVLCDCNLPLATRGTEGIPDLHFLSTLQVCVRTHAHVLMFMDVSTARDSVQSQTFHSKNSSPPVVFLSATTLAILLETLESRHHAPSSHLLDLISCLEIATLPSSFMASNKWGSASLSPEQHGPPSRLLYLHCLNTSRAPWWHQDRNLALHLQSSVTADFRSAHDLQREAFRGVDPLYFPTCFLPQRCGQECRSLSENTSWIRCLPWWCALPVVNGLFAVGFRRICASVGTSTHPCDDHSCRTRQSTDQAEPSRERECTPKTSVTRADEGQ